MAEAKQSKDNLSFWKSVSTTTVAATKEVKQGARKFTAIDAYYQIMEATDEFGMYGIGWGVRDESFDIIADELLKYHATMFYKWNGEEGLIPISASIRLYMGQGDKRRIDDDCVKKVTTDALTKGLSKLGFNADVFLGKFDDNKYVQELKASQDAAGAASLKADLIAELGMTASMDRVKAIWAGNPALKQDAEFADAVKKANHRLTQPKE